MKLKKILFFIATFVLISCSSILIYIFGGKEVETVYSAVIKQEFEELSATSFLGGGSETSLISSNYKIKC